MQCDIRAGIQNSCGMKESLELSQTLGMQCFRRLPNVSSKHAESEAVLAEQCIQLRQALCCVARGVLLGALCCLTAISPQPVHHQ